MKPLPLPSGIRYGTDSFGQKVCLGARLGRPNQLPRDLNRKVKLNLVKLPLQDGRCYDKQGAYWGAPDTMYYASANLHDEVLDDWYECRVFVRATTRKKAKAAVRKLIPKASFYR